MSLTRPSIEETSAGETIFERDAVFFENRTAVKFGVRTDNPYAGAVITVFGISGKDGKLFVFFRTFRVFGGLNISFQIVFEGFATALRIYFRIALPVVIVQISRMG